MSEQAEMTVIDREKAFLLMEWQSLSTIIPELVPFQTAIYQAAGEIEKAKRDNKCPPCVENQYAEWERAWLIRLNAVIFSNPQVQGLVFDYLRRR